MEVWLKWQSTCLAKVRPQIQNHSTAKKKKSTHFKGYLKIKRAVHQGKELVWALEIRQMGSVSILTNFPSTTLDPGPPDPEDCSSVRGGDNTTAMV
jgi:hypothetical protein